MSSNKIIALAGLTLLLTGCGSGYNVQPTVIDSFDMTESLADSKKGATYLSEFLISRGAKNTTVSDLYSRGDVTGLESAHSSGWTGKGKTITVLDVNFDHNKGHGRNVSDIAGLVAPGASKNEFVFRGQLNADKWLITMNSDVVTTSLGFSPSGVESDGALKSRINDFIRDIESSDAVFTVAAQHSNWDGDRDGTDIDGRGGFTNCPNSGVITIADCNTWAAYDLDNDNVIYVGEVNSENEIPIWSNQAGDAHKNQFIVTSSDEITTASNGEPKGNSYAAPRVAGASALVRQKFPSLTGSQAATVILHTADDLGAAGVDAVYGHGKLNVGKALAPVGNLH